MLYPPPTLSAWSQRSAAVADRPVADRPVAVLRVTPLDVPWTHEAAKRLNLRTPAWPTSLRNHLKPDPEMEVGEAAILLDVGRYRKTAVGPFVCLNCVPDADSRLR